MFWVLCGCEGYVVVCMRRVESFEWGRPFFDFHPLIPQLRLYVQLIVSLPVRLKIEVRFIRHAVCIVVVLICEHTCKRFEERWLRPVEDS